VRESSRRALRLPDQKLLNLLYFLTNRCTDKRFSGRQVDCMPTRTN